MDSRRLGETLLDSGEIFETLGWLYDPLWDSMGLWETLVDSRRMYILRMVDKFMKLG